MSDKETSLKERISYWLAVASFVVGMGLMIAGFIIDPTGKIDGTVIGACGMLLTFTGAVLGISFHYSAEDAAFKASIYAEIAKMKEDDKD